MTKYNERIIIKHEDNWENKNKILKEKEIGQPTWGGGRDVMTEG